MRLLADPSIWALSQRDIIVLTRHGVDIPHLTQELNQPLSDETKPDIRVLGNEIVQVCRQLHTKAICIHHSTRLRGIQSTAILAEEFFGSGIPTQICEAPGIREVYQGEFLIRNYSGKGEYRPLVDAWTAWQEQLNKNELLYRFGDHRPTDSINCEYPTLQGWFTRYGENQAEFSIRLYSFLKKILSDPGDHLTTIVAHQASCSRIQRIFSTISRLSSVDEFKPGEFVRILEKQGERMTIDYASGIIVKCPPRELSLLILEKELQYLKSIT
jgi:broad specificity phosphatase PhoE